VLRDTHAYGPAHRGGRRKEVEQHRRRQIALLLGDKRLDRYLRRFGFGSRLSVGLPGEQAGIFHPGLEMVRHLRQPHRRWGGIGVTALQMLGAFCAIANDGQLMRPHVGGRRGEGRTGTCCSRAALEKIGEPAIGAGTARTMRGHSAAGSPKRAGRA